MIKLKKIIFFLKSTQTKLTRLTCDMIYEIMTTPQKNKENH